VAIAMTNQSAWHLAAFAALRCGATLVPLDCKLSGPELAGLLAHSGAGMLVVEHHLWRAVHASPETERLGVRHVVVVGAPEGTAPPSPASGMAHRFEACASTAPAGDPAPRGASDVACIVYSSGTGGRPKGCMLSHGNYLAQFQALVELHPLRPGVTYLSILPTNHAIDFMVGFLGPYLCGATVVHLRTLRPELVREAFVRYRITHVALVPMVLKNLRASLEERFAALPPVRRALLQLGIRLHRALGAGRPRPRLAKRLLGPVHDGFGGRLEAIFVGGAATDPDTIRFFLDLGIPVANGYGLTEAGTAVTLDRLDPPRPGSVGVALPGTEVRIRDAGPDGVGEVVVRGPTVMLGYLDDPPLTAETIVDGWLRTGDLGRLDAGGHLTLVGRRRNMIVTEGGKNVYPEDVEAEFAGSAAAELCLCAAHYLWPERSGDERLLLIVRVGSAARDEVLADLHRRNRRLPDFQRAQGILPWDEDFPRTASLKLRRDELARRVAATRRADDVLPMG
jgi:long-chain acyl-CoA synthetase